MDGFLSGAGADGGIRDEHSFAGRFEYEYSAKSGFAWDEGWQRGVSEP